MAPHLAWEQFELGFWCTQDKQVGHEGWENTPLWERWKGKVVFYQQAGLFILIYHLLTLACVAKAHWWILHGKITPENQIPPVALAAPLKWTLLSFNYDLKPESGIFYNRSFFWSETMMRRLMELCRKTIFDGD